MRVPAPLISRLRYLFKILLVAAIYAGLARLSLLLQFESSNASPVWAPSGFAFAIIILFGYRLAPAVWLGAFISNLSLFLYNQTAPLPLAAGLSSAIAIGNTLEALAGTYLSRKIISGFSADNFLKRAEHVFEWLFVALVVGLISAITGVTALSAAGIIPPGHLSGVLITWWLGDVSGMIILTPLLVTWAEAFRHRPVFPVVSNKRKAEVALLFISIIGASVIIFDNWFAELTFFKWAFWIIPVLVWAAIRFNQRETTTALVLCAAITIWGAINGHGPFGNLPLNDGLITAEAFACTVIITMLILNASLIERKLAQARLLESYNQLEQRVRERTAQLEERNQFVEAIFDSVEELMVVFDPNFNYVSLNRKTEEVYGLKRGKVIGKNILAVYPALESSETYRSLQQAMKGESIHKILHRSEVVNRYFENFFIPLKNEAQEVYGVLVIGHDNTQLVESSQKLKQREEEIRLSEQKFRKLLENAPDAMVIVNRQGIIELVNAQTEKFFGYEKGELVGKEVEILIPGQFQSIHHLHREKYFSQPQVRGMGAELNLSGRRKDGSEFPVEISLSPLETPDGVLVSASIRDITLRRQTEIELRKKTDEVVLMNSDLQKLNRELQTFVYAASHDLQEPLRKISVFTSHILEREAASLSQSGKDSFIRIQKGAARMKQLIEDLLSYSRTSSSDKHFEKTDLNQILEQVRSDLHEKISQSNASIETGFLPEMNVIPFQFHQLFINMISNSLKFAKPSIAPRIMIQGQLVDNKQVNIAHGLGARTYHHLTIRDNGIGFDDEHRDRIFELFQRLHGRNEFEGSGVGLSICKKIVENHDGIITAKGEPDFGATFHIYIPTREFV